MAHSGNWPLTAYDAAVLLDENGFESSLIHPAPGMRRRTQAPSPATKREQRTFPMCLTQAEPFLGTWLASPNLRRPPISANRRARLAPSTKPSRIR